MRKAFMPLEETQNEERWFGRPSIGSAAPKKLARWRIRWTTLKPNVTYVSSNRDW